jgi:hypothetical protein
MSTIVSFRSALACAALFLLGFAGTALADASKDKPGDKADRTSDLSFEISAGAKYDGNVSVVEIDTPVAADDFAAVIQVSADYLLRMNPQTTLKVGYDFDQSLYEEFDQYDYQSHAGSAKVKYKLGTESDSSDVALSYRFTYSLLGGDGFLSQHRISPTFGVYVDKPLYLLFEYIYADKDFIQTISNGRDAVVHSGGVDGYYFIDGTKFMIIAGYQYDDSDATDVIFDYVAHNGKIKLVKRLGIGGLDPKLSLGYEHETRNYSSPDSSSTADVKRHDNRDKFKASVELPVNDILYVMFEYQYRAFRRPEGYDPSGRSCLGWPPKMM